MIFDLVKDFADVLDAMPEGHPRRRILKLLDEAVRRDVHFIDRHPTTFFQCMWNTCWWYDCPEAASYYLYEAEERKTPLPWEQPGPKLFSILKVWRQQRICRTPWLRALMPPTFPLGGRQVGVLRGHMAPVTCVAYSPDGNRIVTADPGSENRERDGLVRLWDAVSGRELMTLKGKTGPVNCVAYSPDGNVIATGGRYDNTNRIWNALTGDPISAVRRHEGDVTCIAFSPDGTRIASGSVDKTVRLWDVATGKQLAVLGDHESAVTHVCFSPDGRQLACSCGTTNEWQHVHIWEVVSRAAVAVHHFSRSTIRSMAYSPDGTRIACATEDAGIRILDASGSQLMELRSQNLESPVSQGSLVHVHGRLTHIPQDDAPITINDASELAAHKLAAAGQPRFATYSKDGRYIIGVYSDSSVAIWNAADGSEAASYRGYVAHVERVALSPDGRRVIGAMGETVRIWRAMREDDFMVLKDAHLDTIDCVAFSAQGHRLASGGNDDTVRQWNPTSGKCLVAFNDHFTPVSLAYSPNGRHLVVGTQHKAICIWKSSHRFYNTLRRLWLKSKRSEIVRVVLNLWALADPAATRRHGKVLELEGSKGCSTAIGYSADGNRIVSSFLEKSVRVWDARQGNVLATIEERSEPVQVSRTAAISPDGTRVVTVAYDGKVRIWDVASGTEEMVLQAAKHDCRERLDSVIDRIEFSVDGRRVIGALGSSFVRGRGRCFVWDSENGELLHVHAGQGDLLEMATDAGDRQFQALARDVETVVQNKQSSESCAWWPVGADKLAAHPTLSLWCIANGASLWLIQLERDTELDPPMIRRIAVRMQSVWLHVRSGVAWPNRFRPSVLKRRFKQFNVPALRVKRRKRTRTGEVVKILLGAIMGLAIGYVILKLVRPE